MALTNRQLNRALLTRQLLARRERLDVVDAVRRVVALQAQEPASPYLALWNRIEGFEASELDAAFQLGTIVKATLMRITLHAVAADDRGTFHEAVTTTLRASRLNDRRFLAAGWSIDDADALVDPLLSFAAEPRSPAEIEQWIDARLGAPPHQGVWWAMRTFAPLVHAPTGGPWSFGPRKAFMAAPDAGRDVAHPTEQPAGHRDEHRDECVRRLLWRYLEAFGPASAQDFAMFAMLRQPTVKPAIEALAGQLVRYEGPSGAMLYDVPGGVVPDEAAPVPPRLMAMWDSVLLAHADRSRILPDAVRQHVIRRNGDVLASVLVDGHVAGVWRPVDGGIEVTALTEIDEEAWDGLADEAARLGAFLAARDPRVYARYGRWWSTLPAGQTRLLSPGVN